MINFFLRSCEKQVYTKIQLTIFFQDQILKSVLICKVFLLDNRMMTEIKIKFQNKL